MDSSEHKVIGIIGVAVPTEDERRPFCVQCRTTATPMWRGGPTGPRSLCNACGIRYRKKRRQELGLDNKQQPKTQQQQPGRQQQPGQPQQEHGQPQHLQRDLSEAATSAVKDDSSSSSSSTTKSSSSLQVVKKRRVLMGVEEAAILLMALSSSSRSPTVLHG